MYGGCKFSYICVAVLAPIKTTVFGSHRLTKSTKCLLSLLLLLSLLFVLAIFLVGKLGIWIKTIIWGCRHRAPSSWWYWCRVFVFDFADIVSLSMSNIGLVPQFAYTRPQRFTNPSSFYIFVNTSIYKGFNDICLMRDVILSYKCLCCETINLNCNSD